MIYYKGEPILLNRGDLKFGKKSIRAKVYFLRICWINKSGPEKKFEINDVGEKQKTDKFFVISRGCKGEAAFRK